MFKWNIASTRTLVQSCQEAQRRFNLCQLFSGGGAAPPPPAAAAVAAFCSVLILQSVFHVLLGTSLHVLLIK